VNQDGIEIQNVAALMQSIYARSGVRRMTRTAPQYGPPNVRYFRTLITRIIFMEEGIHALTDVA
jgi:hypothetical protein